MLVAVVVAGCASPSEQRLTGFENQGSVWERANATSEPRDFPWWLQGSPDSRIQQEFLNYTPRPSFRR